MSSKTDILGKDTTVIAKEPAEENKDSAGENLQEKEETSEVQTAEKKEREEAVSDDEEVQEVPIDRSPG